MCEKKNVDNKKRQMRSIEHGHKEKIVGRLCVYIQCLAKVFIPLNFFHVFVMLLPYVKLL